MNRPRARYNFPGVRCTTGNEVFPSSRQWNPLPVDNEGGAPLHHEHVFIKVVNVGGRGSCFGARPERHLASVQPVENVPFDARSCLIGVAIRFAGFFMNTGKSFIAAPSLLHILQRRIAPRQQNPERLTVIGNANNLHRCRIPFLRLVWRAFFCLPVQVANDHGFLPSGCVVPPPREPKIQVMSA